MFIASFTQATSAPFIADKNGQMPYVGTVQAGNYNSSLYNGSMFVRGGYQPNKLYLCQNTPAVDSDGEAITDQAGKAVHNVEIIAEVSVTEFVQLRAQFGAPKRITETVAVAEEAEEPAETEAGLV